MSNPFEQTSDPETEYDVQSDTVEQSLLLDFPAFVCRHDPDTASRFIETINRFPTASEALMMNKLTHLKKKKFSVRSEFDEGKLDEIAFYLMSSLPIGAFQSLGGVFSGVYKAAKADKLDMTSCLPTCFFVRQDPTVEDTFVDNINNILNGSNRQVAVDLGDGIVTLSAQEVNSRYRPFLIYQTLKVAGEFPDAPEATAENLFPGGYAYPEITTVLRNDRYIPLYNDSVINLPDVYVLVSDVDVPTKYKPFQEIYAKVELIKRHGSAIDRFLHNQRKEFGPMAEFVVPGDPDFALTRSKKFFDKQSLPDMKTLAIAHTKLIKKRDQLGKNAKTAICAVPPNLDNTCVKALAMTGNDLISEMKGKPFVCIGTGKGDTLRALVDAGSPSDVYSIDPVTNEVGDVRATKYNTTLSAALPELEKIEGTFHFFSDASVAVGDINHDYNTILPKHNRTDYPSTALKPDDQEYSLEESLIKLARMPNSRGAFKFVMPHCALSDKIMAKMYAKTLHLLSELMIYKEVRLCHPLRKHEGEFYIRVGPPQSMKMIKTLIRRGDKGGPRAAFSTLVSCYQSAFVAVNFRSCRPDANPTIMWDIRKRQIQATSKIMKHKSFRHMFRTIEELDLFAQSTAVAKVAAALQVADEFAHIRELFVTYGVLLSEDDLQELANAYDVNKDYKDVIVKYFDLSDPMDLYHVKAELQSKYGINIEDHLIDADLDDLAKIHDASGAERKQLLQDYVFPFVASIAPPRAGVITGMLIETMPYKDLLELVTDSLRIRDAVHDAMSQLDA